MVIVIIHANFLSSYGIFILAIVIIGRFTRTVLVEVLGTMMGS